MARFHTDDALQKQVRDAVLGPGLYGTYSREGRYVYIDKGALASVLQKRFAVDTVVQGRRGDAVFIEEKIVRWTGRPYTALTLETKSCTVPGHESEGWMAYGQADFLNYAMCLADGNVLCRLIDFPKLKAAFWPVEETFRETISTQHNRTACRIVPLRWIAENVGIHPPAGRLIYACPEGAEIVKQYNGTHYLNAERPQMDLLAQQEGRACADF